VHAGPEICKGRASAPQRKRPPKGRQGKAAGARTHCARESQGEGARRREKAKAKELAALEKAKAKEAALLAKQKEKELKAQLKLQAQELLKLRRAGRSRRNGDAERALLLRAEARPRTPKLVALA